ncbi:response regulator [Trichocoleus sp. FACHB-262]|uniref:response regulator n=1 Tax=Trichocoleus sp. FACHB-262 TaxID=2692869 RepID=UPI00168A0BA2|nr:response regulator [Trichocoleus sp. FACHB-262]MBD2120712.1 response regulator [Trichocoleus sp. FACHB-262]
MYQIAIVDDNEAWCFILEARLGQYGYAVSTFTDPDAFLREAERFDLALIDFSMPPRRYQINTDGPDVICRLRQRVANPPLVILISSFFTDDILSQTSDLGLEADAYLSKSVESAGLLRQIDRLLAPKRSLARGKSQGKTDSQQRSERSSVMEMGDSLRRCG